MSLRLEESSRLDVRTDVMMRVDVMIMVGLMLERGVDGIGVVVVWHMRVAVVSGWDGVIGECLSCGEEGSRGHRSCLIGRGG